LPLSIVDLSRRHRERPSGADNIPVENTQVGVIARLDDSIPWWIEAGTRILLKLPSFF
jgi:hypothetical protein